MKMRKYLLIVGCLMIAGVLKAENWKTANSITVSWDAVQSMAEGDVMKYQVYTSTNLVNPNLAAKAVGTEVVTTEQVVNFMSEGKYYLGVETVRYPAGEATGTGIKSANISWSNDVSVCKEGTFGVIYYSLPKNAIGLRLTK